MIRLDAKEKLERFLREYGNYYTPDEIRNIRKNFISYIYHHSYSNDIFDEIAAYLDLVEPEKNHYLTFSKMIGELYGYDINILEIASGIFPVFSKYIDDEQTKIGKGTITAIDPYVIDKKIGNIKLIRDEFTRNTDVDGFDLIVSIKPCSITEEILNVARVTGKQFFVAFCNCEPYQIYDFDVDMTRAEWLNMMKFAATRQASDEFDVVIHDSLPGFPYPVFYKKKK